MATLMWKGYRKNLFRSVARTLRARASGTGLASNSSDGIILGALARLKLVSCHVGFAICGEVSVKRLLKRFLGLGCEPAQVSRCMRKADKRFGTVRRKGVFEAAFTEWQSGIW